ncbi:unnamed protein product, partial [Linum tenue]
SIVQTCAGAVILTDVVFWCLILPFESNQHFQLTMVCKLQSTPYWFFLSQRCNMILPFPWFRIAYFVQWSCIYIVFQWVLHACGLSWWPYPFLELSTPWAPLWYFCLALVHVPCYGIYFLLVKAKYSILPKWFPAAFVLTSSL